jgi:hypothetical protein
MKVSKEIVSSWFVRSGVFLIFASALVLFASSILDLYASVHFSVLAGCAITLILGTFLILTGKALSD